MITCAASGCMNDPRHTLHGWFTLDVTDAMLEYPVNLSLCDEHFDVAAEEAYEGQWTLT